jgi:polyhydroxyalkanoate synthase subunit PhaC
MAEPQPHPEAAFAAFTELNRKLLEAVVKPVEQDGSGLNAAEIFQSMHAGLTQDAGRWLELQQRYYQKQVKLWTSIAMPGAAPSPPATGPRPDPRFRAPEWREPYFQYLAQSYLLATQWVEELLSTAELDAQARRKVSFFARQYMDAMSPANFPWSNPEALKLAAATNGDSLAQGLKNLAADLDKGLVSMTDERAFEVGRNLAITPGAVVYENDFLQLIQYRATTDTVYERPLIVVPPCINKFYVLDLQPHNSLVRHAIEAGHTVFIVSWRNMPPEMGRATWDDYLQHGVIAALTAAQEITGAGQVNALGFCVGGTLLSSALAVMRGRGENPVASLTLLATMLDYCDTGELSVFIDEAYVTKRERDFADGGVLQGRELALTFASLRANDLIWFYVVNNYLKGKTPDPFDLLYWNSDSTNLPGAMYAYYIRNMYLENNLRVPGRLTMLDVPVDLKRLDMPAYVLATREDHIVPWKTAYTSARLLGGRIDFVLGASGHIAGVINPPARNRRSYSTGGSPGESADAWLAGAATHAGSWWTHWTTWLQEHAGERRPACPSPGSAAYPEIEPAPGRYVKIRTT